MLILFDDKLYINEKVYPYNEYTLSQLVEVNKNNTISYDRVTNTKYLIWCWNMETDFRSILGKWTEVPSRLLPGHKHGCQHWITDNFMFSSFSVIISEHDDVVKGENPFLKLREIIDNYNSVHRYFNLCTNTETNTAIKLIKKKYGYKEFEEELKQEVRDCRRCPGTALVVPLVYSNKAGIVWHNAEYEGQLTENVYGFDASSSYPAQCFYGDFPLGELKRYTADADTVKALHMKGCWYAVELVSDEIIELPADAFRPYKDNKKKKYIRFENGYHYTVTPYDYMNMVQHFSYDPFTDKRLMITKVIATDKVGYLNKKYLDFIYKIYQAKSNATGYTRDAIKKTINSIIGKGHPPRLAGMSSADLRHWYINNYMCPQFAQHIVARERYTITSLACKLGVEKVLSLSTDCIKSTDPALIEVMSEFNKQHKAHMDSLGYTDTTLGMWQPEHYKWLVFIRDRVYFGVNTEGKFITALSSFAIPQDLTVAELFESNRIERAENQCGDLWNSTENRLKARARYYGIKMEEHVQKLEEQAG